jgi:hypothetical protein
MVDICQNIPVIPQFGFSCWFNAVYTSMVYSDEISKLIYHQAITDNWHTNTQGAFKVFTLLFMNYIKAIKKNNNPVIIDKLKYFIKKYKIEIILYDYLKHYESQLARIHHLILYEGSDTVFFSRILKKLGITVMSIASDTFQETSRKYRDIQYEYNDKGDIALIHYAATTRSTTDVSPDIILCYTNNQLDAIEYPEMRQSEISGYGKDEITYKGHTYKLDSILLEDENREHIISCITCNGSKYIYNGWWRKTKKTCNLIPFDWQSNFTSFCLDTVNCQLPDYDKKAFETDENLVDMCFNVKDNYKMLVYVKVKSYVDTVKKHPKKIDTIKIYDDNFFDIYDRPTISLFFDKYLGHIKDENRRKEKMEKLKKLNLKELRDEFFKVFDDQAFDKAGKMELSEEHILLQADSDISKMIKNTFTKLITDTKNETKLKELFRELITHNPLDRKLYNELNNILTTRYKITGKIENFNNFIRFLKKFEPPTEEQVRKKLKTSTSTSTLTSTSKYLPTFPKK